MWTWLRRHPFPVDAFFEHSVVLTYALPAPKLAPYVPRGLVLDVHRGWGFLAIALVQTRGLRPAGLPVWLGQDFFLAGYRVFVRYRDRAGRTRRGLRILRSYADRKLMVAAGNMFTHYNYRLARVSCDMHPGRLHIATSTPSREADLDVEVDLASVAGLPDGSPFANLQDARRFAGPLPFTFDHEEESDSMVLIEGRREHWEPRPVRAEVRVNTFIERLGGDTAPRLANVFWVHDVPYRWLRGRRESLEASRG